MPYIQNALSFTIEILVGLFLIAVILRFLCQLCRVDFRNPICQAIVTLTNPPLKILRRFIPGLFGIDLASVVLIILVSCIKFGALILISGHPIQLPGLILFSIGKALNTAIWILIIATIVRSLASWFPQASHHPVIHLLASLTEPLLAPVRRLLPDLGGLDLSPIVVIIILNIVQQLAAYPIIDLAVAMMM